MIIKKEIINLQLISLAQYFFSLVKLHKTIEKCKRYATR